VDLFTSECCYDGADCKATSKECPSCPQSFAAYIKTTNECVQSLNIEICCFSNGQCEKQLELGCIDYMVMSLFYYGAKPTYDLKFSDSSDSDLRMTKHICPVPHQSKLGDGICDMAIAVRGSQCCQDGGDCAFTSVRVCPSCKQEQNYQKALRTRQCFENLRTEECCYSFGECHRACPTCNITK
jgi:hypothetical protein